MTDILRWIWFINIFADEPSDPPTAVYLMIRNILGVIAGYAIFVASSLAFFNVSGQKPHDDASILFQLVTALYGTLFSFLSGWVLQRITRTGNLKVNYILAIIMAVFATFSFFKADGSHWTQLLAIFIFSPVSILGGLFYNKRAANVHRG